MKRPILFLIVLAISSGSFLAAQEKTANSEKLGKVHFPVSCTPPAQQQFDVAVSMLHSFWYPQDFKAFAEVANADPTCAMGYWGMAMSRRTNPLVGAPNRVVLQEGLDAIAKAKAAGAKTQRERDYIGAIETYYKDWEKRDYRTRVLAYESAMEQMYARYPEDSEAAIFYALALNEAVTVLPPDKNYTRQLKAAAILEKVLAQHGGEAGDALRTGDGHTLGVEGQLAYMGERSFHAINHHRGRQFCVSGIDELGDFVRHAVFVSFIASDGTSENRLAVYRVLCRQVVDDQAADRIGK